MVYFILFLFMVYIFGPLGLSFIFKPKTQIPSLFHIGPNTSPIPLCTITLLAWQTHLEQLTNQSYHLTHSHLPSSTPYIMTIPNTAPTFSTTNSPHPHSTFLPYKRAPFFITKGLKFSNSQRQQRNNTKNITPPNKSKKNLGKIFRFLDLGVLGGFWT